MQLSRHTSETSKKLEEKLGRLPLRFEAVARRQDSRVRFVGRAHGYGIILTEHGAAFTLRSKSLISRQTHSRQSEEWRNFEVLEMTLKNAHRHPKIQGVDETSGTSNYFRGKTGWRTDVKSFARVRYEQIYDGVDLVFYGNPQQLEYDFIVAPGADPQAIKLRFNTKDRLRIDGPGSLVLKKNDVELALQAPRAYQDVQGTRRQVECQFRLSPSGEIAFKLGPYDQSVALTIDPVFSYSTYLGGTGFSSQSDEIVNGVAVDAAGNAYVVGTTISTDFPVQNAYKSTGGGFTDAFVSKINPSGTALVYSTYLGGDRNDEGLAIAVDASGAAYVTGVSASTNFPTTPGAFQTQGLDTDVFVTKLSPAGNALVYSTLLNGERRSLPGGINLASSEDGRAIAVDSQGQACVVGETQSGNFPRANEFQTNPAGGFDAFVTKLNASGTGLLFSTYLGGSNTDRANGVALDGAGNIYLTGEVYSTDFPTTPGSLKPTRTASGNSIGFVTRFSNTGAMIYSTYLGDVTEAARGIAVDSSGNSFVTGETSPNSIFPTTPNAIKPARDLGAVYRSNSAGGSWQGSGLSHDVAVNGVAVDPANSAKLYAGTQAGLFRSIDTGGAWSLLGLPGIQVL